MEIEGISSAWHLQETGIRQGCPLSPYLFLIVMTAIFYDIKQDRRLAANLRVDRVIGASFDEVLYADDTIIFSESPTTLGKLLRQIEEEGAKYGLRLNKSKCELLNLNCTQRIRFRDRTLVPLVSEARYLGCVVNDKGDPKREVNKRLSETYLIWKKLEMLWKHSDGSVKEKLIVYDAVVRSKLVYALESLQINDDLKRKMDAFQLKGRVRI